ncbi:MAG: 3D domain-containing protein [Lachnospiraceae bacterium]
MIGDGWHWYDEQIAWSDFGGKPDLIKVYGISDDTKTLITQIGDPSIADQKPSEAIKTVDAAPDQETEATGELGPGTASSSSYKQGESLGMFKTTGYCNCDSCSGGHSRTYSGTVPKANHTISADLDLYPLGTKLMIDGIVYTVEDKGSSVMDNKIDIYYASHEEAVAHGSITQEVFRVVE